MTALRTVEPAITRGVSLTMRRIATAASAAALTLCVAGCQSQEPTPGSGSSGAGTPSSGAATGAPDNAEEVTPGPDADDSGTGDANSSTNSAEDEIEPELTAELPGGGDQLFPDRRFVAAYGTPGTPALGILGEQGLEEAIELVHGYAEEYQAYSEEPVQPAFEIITTVAAAEPGADGLYTTPIDADVIEPWVEAAAEEDIYVILDLQPGHATFLGQAQMYEDLLAEPHVGLALDPEWRLSPGQVHMQQVGSVTAEEINEVATWLAELTRDHDLPQKMLVLHQFKHSMIQERGAIDTDHEELAFVLHADGHGSPDLKLETYSALQDGLSDDIWMAWKNFYDEDTPTFSPEDTYDIEPKPWFVSYQ